MSKPVNLDRGTNAVILNELKINGNVHQFDMDALSKKLGISASAIDSSIKCLVRNGIIVKLEQEGPKRNRPTYMIPSK